MSRKKDITLNIECEKLTSQAIADIVNNILEFLLYQRQQIPFVYQIFRFYVKKWQEKKDAQSMQENSNLLFCIEKQRDAATYTQRTVSAMKTMIGNLLDRNHVVCFRLLFGATSFTAKESYTIHLPMDKTMKKHTYENHPLPFSSINQAILKLLAAKELLSTFSKQLPQTNIFLEVETIDKTDSSPQYYKTTKENLLPKQYNELPHNCADIHIHLSQTYPPNFHSTQFQNNCCKEITIFEDFRDLNLNNNMEGNDSIAEEQESMCEQSSVKIWWESEIVVRGFKEKLMKGVNLWN